MRKKVFSPVVECQPQAFTKIAFQNYKLPDGSTFTVKYDEISLILQQNKLLNTLSADDIRSMLESIGNNQPDTSTLSDEQLLSYVSSRHIQEPCVLKANFEHALKAYHEGKQTWKQALEDMKKSPSEDENKTE